MTGCRTTVFLSKMRKRALAHDRPLSAGCCRLYSTVDERLTDRPLPTADSSVSASQLLYACSAVHSPTFALLKLLFILQGKRSVVFFDDCPTASAVDPVSQESHIAQTDATTDGEPICKYFPSVKNVKQLSATKAPPVLGRYPRSLSTITAQGVNNLRSCSLILSVYIALRAVTAASTLSSLLLFASMP